MRRLRWLLAPVVLALFVPVDGRAQNPRLGERLDPRTSAAVQALADSARLLSLPAEAIIQKALEGASKGADEVAIVDAARALVRDLAAARRAFGDRVGADVLRLGAAALDAGLTTRQLERIGRHRDVSGIAGALAGAMYLVSRGVPAAESIGIVDAMLAARLSPADFAALQRLVEHDVRGGAPAAQSAQVRSRAIIMHGPRLLRGGSIER